MRQGNSQMWKQAGKQLGEQAEAQAGERLGEQAEAQAGEQLGEQTETQAEMQAGKRVNGTCRRTADIDGCKADGLGMTRSKLMTRAGCGAALLMAALVLGACGRQYDEVKVPSLEGAVPPESGQAGALSETTGEAFLAEISTRETTLTTETAPSFTEVSETVYVTGDEVNVRDGASTSAGILGKLYKGEALKRVAVSDTWSRVIYQERECYISTQYVSTVQPETESMKETENAAGEGNITGAGEVTLNPSWKYADFSKIHSGAAVLYRSEAASKKGITVCVNAGHGTKGGGSVKTQCHPDGTPKVTGGTTGAGATTAVAVSSGMEFSDGTAEAKVTLAMAKKLKAKLLAAGYDVLMIRESEDVQLDNVARTVIANNAADCHIALHWDSTTSNKGAFYMSVPNVASYRNMEPVKSNWQKHNALGESLITGLKGAGVKIFSGGSMEMDLTQTSFSTIPSIDIELGDKASDHSDGTLDNLADGLLAGINHYYNTGA